MTRKIYDQENVLEGDAHPADEIEGDAFVERALQSEPSSKLPSPVR